LAVLKFWGTNCFLKGGKKMEIPYMEIPYDEWELKIALLGLDEKKFTNGKIKELSKELAGRIPSEKKDFNKKVAEHNGIGVKELIKSPNYKTLCQGYTMRIIRESVDLIAKKFDISERQAWALVAVGLGLIDF
jgi:hypothetical protein